jgi:hypothetical protein
VDRWIRKGDLLEVVKEMNGMLAGAETVLVKGKYLDVSKTQEDL